MTKKRINLVFLDETIIEICLPNQNFCIFSGASSWELGLWPSSSSKAPAEPLAVCCGQRFVCLFTYAAALLARAAARKKS